MEGARSRYQEFEFTFSGVCAVPDWTGQYCGWRTDPCASENVASAKLTEHIQFVHPGNPAKVGYVNTTPIINKLRL